MFFLSNTSHTPQTSNLSVGSKALVLVHLNEDPLGIVFQQWNTCGSLFTKLLLELLFLGMMVPWMVKVLLDLLEILTCFWMSARIALRKNMKRTTSYTIVHNISMGVVYIHAVRMIVLGK